MKKCSPDRQMYTVQAHRLVLNFLTVTNHREYRTSGTAPWIFKVSSQERKV